MPLPGFAEYLLSIRNTWIGAVGWLIEGAERRVMVRCVTAWTVGGAAKGVRWLAAERCFRHQVLLRGCGQWYRCGRDRVAHPSEQENLDPRPQRNRRR